MSDRAPATTVFDVAGMDCADCARSVERVVGALPGVASADVSFGTGTLTVESNTAPDELDQLNRAVSGAVDRAGYSAVMRTGALPGRTFRTPWWKNRRLLPAAIGAVLWIAAFAVMRGFDAPRAGAGIFALAIVIGGYPIARAAWTALRARRLDMNVLMTISVIGAAALGEWSEGALVVVLFAIGTTMQAITFDRTRGAINGLLDQAPDEATVLRRGVEVHVAAAELAPGDLVRVRPGERLPADGTVIEGASNVAEAAITGESMPVAKRPGDTVFAGTINGAGSLLVRVDAAVTDSTLARIVHMVEEAQASKAPSQQLVDRFAAVYTPVVVLAAAAIAVAGWAFTDSPQTWAYRALVLLVIACPCALVISTPVSIVSAIGAATRMGMLVKGGAALEDMARVRTIALDKTGTITIGRPAVVAVIPAHDLTEAEVLARAAAVESHSEHGLARAIVARALHDAVSVPEALAFGTVAGVGAYAEVDGRRHAIGGDHLVAEAALGPEDRRLFETLAERHGQRAETALALVEFQPDGVSRLLGVIAVADRIRSTASGAVAALRESGIAHVAMLSGDRQAVADAVARQVGIDVVYATLLPGDKASRVSALRGAGPVAMVGDGVNDAPALASADVGIAMGIGGTDAALESADVVLMRDDLAALPPLVSLAQRTLLVIRQNVTISMLTKLAAILLGTLGFVNLWIAVLLDVGTSLLVTANGLRLARVSADQLTLAEESDCAEAGCGCGGDHAHDDVDHPHHLTAAD